MAKGKNKRFLTESKMNDETKPETAADTAGTAAEPVQSNAPAVESVGIADQSGTESGAPDSQPESASADASSPVAAAPAPVVTQSEAPAPVVQAPAPAPVAPPVAPVVQQAAKPSESVDGITPWADVNRLIANVPKAKHAIILFLMEYAQDMAPKRPVTVQAGSNYQANLYRALHTLINKEDEHFRPLFTAVLKIFEQEGDRCFRATHAFRFMESVPLNKDERHSFTGLIDMLRLLGPVEGRKDAAKQISLAKVLAKNMTDTGRARVLSYFDGTI